MAVKSNELLNEGKNIQSSTKSSTFTIKELLTLLHQITNGAAVTFNWGPTPLAPIGDSPVCFHVCKLWQK